VNDRFIPEIAMIGPTSTPELASSFEFIGGISIRAVVVVVAVIGMIMLYRKKKAKAHAESKPSRDNNSLLLVIHNG
jgi:hypothetical protein